MFCRAPTPSNAPSFLEASHDVPRDHNRSRSRSRGPRRPPPPRPTVEDELKSLARESSASPIPSYDPPLRGIIDQNPIILEADVTKSEAARLQSQPCPVEKDTNPERRFVLIPKSDTYSPNEEGEDHHARRPRANSTRSSRPEPPIIHQKKEPAHPPIARRRSRQDLPSLETKIPREIPPQYRRSASAFAATPKDHDEIFKLRKPTADSLLSPDVNRGGKDYFSQSAPRHHDGFGGRTPTPVTEKRASGVSYSARPVTPTSERRTHAELGTRSRRNTGEKFIRPQQLSEEFSGRRQDRPQSPHSVGRSSKSSNHSSRRYSISSEDDIADSDSDKGHRRRQEHHNKHEGRRRQSPSRSNRSSMEVKALSKMTSPLPSPKVSPSQVPRGDPFERIETFPPVSRDRADRRRKESRDVSPFSPDEDTRADRLNPLDPRPKPRQPSTAPSTKPSIPPAHAVPIPIPSRIDLQSPGDTKKTPSFPQFDDKKSSSPPTAPYWQPPPFEPGNLEKPVGSYRRFSQDIEKGKVAPLPSCPRTTFTRGRTDWLTLPQCPSFDICPSCFNSIIAPTEYCHLFVPAPRRPPETEVLCDFGSSPWYRIAWLLTLKEKRRDLKLFYGLANITTKVPPCLGKHEAVRQWYSIIDPKTDAPIRGFDVCYSCVKSVETLLSPLKGIFIRVDSHNSSATPRICDLRFDSKRFIQYFDALETTADRADYDDLDDPDLRELASLARRLAAVPECQHDRELVDRRWHIITQLPEFTVCEECFDEVVWPELEERKAIPLMFNKTLQRIPKASCQLYSTKMRGIFRLAVDSDDYKLLASKARERKTVETAYKANLTELRKNARGIPAVEKEIVRIGEEWKKWE